MSGIRIRGAGHCVPEKVVTNDDLARRVDTSDEWIASRTGIRRRHVCEGESQAELCIGAARMALEQAGAAPAEIGVCIVATMTPDTLMPSTACRVQSALGLPEDTLCFDLNAACTGFVFALHTAECLLAASPRKLALVIGGECLSRIVDWDDRSTCILFGDGAGAAVVEYRAEWPSIGAVTGARGDATMLHAQGPGQASVIQMEGTQVFKFAVETVSKTVTELLEKYALSLDEVDWFVFHQANARIIDLVGRKCAIPPEKLAVNIAEYGNTSAASIPIALSEMQGRIRPGQRVMLVGFGGGLTWGGAIIQYA